MNSRWVKLYDNILRWEWFTDSKMVHFFIYLLVKASYNETRHKGTDIVPGQLPFGRDAASRETGLSVQNIRTCVKRLKSTNEITIETSSKGSIITIVRWKEYQGITSNLTNKQPTSNQQVTTTKKERKKEYKNKNNICDLENEKNKKQESKSDTCAHIVEIWNDEASKRGLSKTSVTLKRVLY